MLETRGIHKIYDNGKRTLEVLKGIDLRIERGKFIAIVGPSGAGKSTLLHILGGLDSPSKGEVLLEGENIYNLSDILLSKLRNEAIGFVFQFYHLLPEFSVLENVIMPGLISAKRKASYLRQKASEFLLQVGLSQKAGYFPHQLSGGEKQRVAIARALVNQPKVLFSDEPTGNLDSETGKQIIELMKKINLENQMTVVLVTHNLELTKVADKVYHLRDGVLVN